MVSPMESAMPPGASVYKIKVRIVVCHILCSVHYACNRFYSSAVKYSAPSILIQHCQGLVSLPNNGIKESGI